MTITGSFVAPAITKRQKNIPNPNPERYSDPSRKGSTYIYTNQRNKFVQDAIHYVVTELNTFPDIGATLEAGVGPLNEQNNVITREDAQAYAAVYPQNAIVQGTPDNYEFAEPSNFDAWSQLEVSSRIPMFRPFLTVTTDESQKPEFQKNIVRPQGPVEEAAVAAMPSFLLKLPRARINDIKKAIQNIFGEATSLGAATLAPSTDFEDNFVFQQPEDINIDDWTQNVTAEKPSVAVYYNNKDESFYYVERIPEMNPSTYDGGNGAGIIARARWSRKAIQEIASFIQKDETRATEIIYTDMMLPVLGTYGPPDRPNPPANSTTWRLCARLPQNAARQLPGAGGSAGESIPHISSAYRKFAEVANIRRKTSTTIGAFKKTLDKTERALAKYAERLASKSITPNVLSGFNLEKEAVKVGTFYSKFDNFLAVHNITPKPSDKVEFCFTEDFKLRCIIYNGEILIKGVGVKLVNTIDNTTSAIFATQTGDPFYDVSPTTFGYIYYSRDIIKESRNKKDPMPWTEFLPLFTFPNPCLKPTELQNNSIKNKKKNQNSPDADGASNRAEESFLDKLFNTERDVEEGLISRMGINEKTFYNSVNSALGSCDTQQAKIAKDGLLIYNTIYGRSDPRRLALRSAQILRDELLRYRVISVQQGADVQTLAVYATRPTMILREAEEWVNDQLYCLFGALGEAIVDQILKPMGSSPAMNKLVRDMSKPPRPPLNLRKKETRDPYKEWRKQLEKLLIRYIKQLIVTIYKDLVSAALGCPDSGDDADHTKKRIQNKYGLIQINKLVDMKGDINLVEVATESGIFKRAQRRKQDNSLEEYETNPELKELRQFNDDTSNILMSGETVDILRGQGTERIHAIIEAVVFEGKTADSPYDVVKNLDSLVKDDTRYATLTITKETLARYFKEIGFLLGEMLSDVLEDITPEDEFCDENGLPLVPLFEGLTDDQARAQVDMQMEMLMEKADRLCAIVSEDIDFGLDLSEWSGFLEEPAFYRQMLNAIRNASNRAMDAINKALTFDVDFPTTATRIRTPYTETELWQNITNHPDFATDEYLRPRADADSSNGFYKELTYRFGGLGAGQKYIELSWNASNARIEVGKTARRDRKNKGSEKILASVTPAETNAPSEAFAPYDYEKYPYTIKNFKPVSWQSINVPYSVRHAASVWTTGWASVQNNLRSMQHALTHMAYGPSIGNWDSTNVQGYADSLGIDKSELRFIGILANNSENIKQGVRMIHLLDEASTPNKQVARDSKKRYRFFLSAITQNVFEPNGDPCNEQEDIEIATAFADSLQSYLIVFFKNIVPLIRSYGGWMTPDTLNLLADYVFQKIKRESKKDGIYPFYIQNAHKLVEVYNRPPSGIPDDPTTDINLKKFDKKEDQIRYFIRQSIVEIFKRLSGPADDGTKFSWLTTSNFFETPALKKQYDRLATYFKLGVLRYGTFANADGNRNYTPKPENVAPWIGTSPTLGGHIAGNEEKGLGSIQNLPDDSSLKNTNMTDFINFAANDFLCFVPLPYILASYAVYYDHIIDINSLTIASKFETYRSIAAANDVFMNAINPDQIEGQLKFFSPFPVVINDVEYYQWDKVYNHIAWYKRLVEHLEDISDAAADIARYLYAALQQLKTAESETYANRPLPDLRAEIDVRMRILQSYVVGGDKYGSMYVSPLTNNIDEGSLDEAISWLEPIIDKTVVSATPLAILYEGNVKNEGASGFAKRYSKDDEPHSYQIVKGLTRNQPGLPVAGAALGPMELMQRAVETDYETFLRYDNGSDRPSALGNAETRDLRLFLTPTLDAPTAAQLRDKSYREFPYAGESTPAKPANDVINEDNGLQAGLKRLREAYKSDAFEWLNENEQTRHVMRLVTKHLRDIVFGDVVLTDENIEGEVAPPLPPANMPFERLRRAIFALSVNIFAGQRDENGDIFPNRINSIKDNTIKELGLEKIYNAGSAIPILSAEEHLNNLEVFARDNDMGDWEET